MKIAYRNAFGEVSIVHPARKFIEQYDTEEQALDYILKQTLPADATDARVMKDDDVPTDRDFRDAWRLGDQGIGVDMRKARDLHRDRIRAARKVEFERNDIAFRDAAIDGNDAARAATLQRRDVLRNAPANLAIDAAQTPEQLKKVWIPGA